MKFRTTLHEICTRKISHCMYAKIMIALEFHHAWGHAFVSLRMHDVILDTHVQCKHIQAIS
jgi:hypothetical protein